MQMGSRLRPEPERVLECLIEVSAPTSEEGANLLSYYPESYEDVDMLRDVVPKFCFPFDRDSEMVDAVQHFTFVLTDIDGLYRFGFCRYPPKAKTCLCILSDLPAFDMFYDMLNTLAELKKNVEKESLTVKQFMDLVLKSDVPKPGNKLIIKVPGMLWRKQYNCPDPTKLPSIPENRNLTDYFSAVNPSNMVSLFASMMCERRIIVTSKKLSLLTACTYSASSLLYPMHWQHVFIPVIPPSLLDYCCAPMPFLVGVHSSLMKRVRDMPLDDVVILDIDKNEIELPFNDLDYLPSEAVNKLNSTLKKTNIAIGDYVSRAFLCAVVVLIGGYRNGLKFSPSAETATIVFERELFINSQPHMKPFLENLLTLQLFERFVHHRLEQLNAGEKFDDIFEEQVAQQEEINSKWASQYKQWLKNGKKKVRKIGGKTEKATYKFFQAGFMQGKAGWKEAVKGLKEKKHDLLDYVKKKDVEPDQNGNLNNPGGLKKSNSLPMKKSLGVNASPYTRKSIGSTLHNQILADMQPDPKKSPCPSTPPPRAPVPPRPAPPCPLPYKTLPCPDVESSPGSLRKSMCRNPNDPPVKDLISFFNSQEDLVEEVIKADPFQEFEEFDYKSGEERSKELSNESDNLKTKRSLSNDSSLSEEKDEGLLHDTMISLSDDTRQFLRNSRSPTARSSDETSPEDGRRELRDVLRNAAVKKTLRELACDHSNSSAPLTHSGSCPSLFEPLGITQDNRDNSESCLQNSSAGKSRANGSNETLLKLSGNPPHSQTNSDDPFLELISRRHNLKLDGLNLADSSSRNGNMSKRPWVSNFE